MKKFNHILMLLLAVILLTSCSKNDDATPTIPPVASNLTGFGASTTRDFTGQIVDESNLPLAGVIVKIAGVLKTTNSQGLFSIKSANVYERLAFITATKVGYLDGSRSIVPTMGNNTIKIMLLSNATTLPVNSGVTSTVTLPNGTKVTFDGAFKTDTGAAYSGAVNVVLRHLDPADANMTLKMPGNLIAKNTAGAVQILETYGMIDVVLLGAAGQKLQITNTAQIEVPISATQLATAPATIPLWHFDEATGIWKEEETATKVAGIYKGTVSHFSWWNFDHPSDTAFICIKVVDNNNLPLSDIKVILDVTGFIIPSNNQYTNSEGSICGNIPANMPFTIKTYDSCGNLLTTTSSVSLTSNSITTLPNIVITSLSTTLISGNLLKCNAAPVINGYVILKYGLKTIIGPVTNGVFDFKTILCGPVNGPYTIEGFDEDNGQTTGTINGLFTSPNTFIGDITACNTITEWIKIKVDNNPTRGLYTGLSAKKASGTNSFSINWGIGGVDWFGFSAQTITPGVYDTTAPNYFGFESSDLIGTTILGSGSSITNNVIFTLSSFGAIGQYIDLTFSGTYTVGGVVHTVSGSCHVKRVS